jgi:hypothetical protein
LGYAKEKATHVVVVDASGAVLESWRGDLAKGDKLPFKASEKPTEVVNPSPGQPRDPKVVSVTGNRRVLFLIRGKDGETFTPVSFPNPEERLATVWIEQGQCFAIYQFKNPGGARMHPVYMDERRLKDEVLVSNFAAVILVEGKGQNPSLLYLVLTQPNADHAKLNEVVVQYVNAALRVAAAEHRFEGADKGDKTLKHKGNVVFLVRNSRDDRRGATTGFSVEQLREIAAATPAGGRELASRHAWKLGTIPDGK